MDLRELEGARFVLAAIDEVTPPETNIAPENEWLEDYFLSRINSLHNGTQMNPVS